MFDKKGKKARRMYVICFNGIVFFNKKVFNE